MTTAPAEEKNRFLQLLSVVAIGTLALSACGDNGDDDADEDTDTEVTDADSNGDDNDAEDNGDDAEAGGLTIEDDHGTHEIPETPESIGAFDNRSFRTLEAFGVELSVAARSLMDEQTHGYATDEDILDTGNHREPDLEQIIAAEPDLIINGQRYSQYYEDIIDVTESAGYDTVVLEFDEAVNDPDTFIEGLIEKTEKLGEVFGEQETAQEIIDEFEAEVDRVTELYDGESTVMGLMTSGGDIQYLAPGTGRTIGPLFNAFDLVPALEQDAEDEAHGDDISVEAIADANPDWLLVTDRDARLDSDDPDYQPADELLAESPALQEVTAVQEGNIVYTPDDMYLTEDIQAYTEFLRDFADALEDAQ
ncbi:siderophore ABC transporter substrate-binding protein [Nesterenkonia alba]|uniref:siderophore ABC transporter substrate-binding protein n=1 Tax=Nesterenkonia alba TaxID=515814 RepID=UPI000491240E|nr:ABC transporter substrate-binding protein [Nesterenkonia alba]